MFITSTTNKTMSVYAPLWLELPSRMIRLRAAVRTSYSISKRLPHIHSVVVSRYLRKLLCRTTSIWVMHMKMTQQIGQPLLKPYLVWKAGTRKQRHKPRTVLLLIYVRAFTISLWLILCKLPWLWTTTWWQLDTEPISPIKIFYSWEID